MYSVDKVKLYVYGVKLPMVQSIMNNLSIDTMVKAYESYKITACRYNYIIESNIATVYLGIEPNWCKDKNKLFRDIIIEYNPNKIELKTVSQLQFLKCINKGRIEIKSMDIAVDIMDVDITSLIVYKRHGNEYKATIEHNNLETLYLGSFGKNGHIKIYNKSKEQNKKSLIWTRFEITYKNLGFMDIKSTDVIEETKLPIILKINQNINIENLKGTDKYLILTSMQNIELLTLLDRRKSKKIKEYHSKYLEQLDIDKKEIIKVYKNFKII